MDGRTGRFVLVYRGGGASLGRGWGAEGGGGDGGDGASGGEGGEDPSGGDEKEEPSKPKAPEPESPFIFSPEVSWFTVLTALGGQVGRYFVGGYILGAGFNYARDWAYMKLTGKSWFTYHMDEAEKFWNKLVDSIPPGDPRRKPVCSRYGECM